MTLTETTHPCRSCGADLEADQLACLQCGEVRLPESGRDRRWIFSTGGIAVIALFLVTSASFAATTALKTGDPHAMQPPPKADIAQAAPVPQTPAATEAVQQQQAEIKKQKIAEKKAKKAAAAKAKAAAPPPAPAPAPTPTPAATPATPAPATPATPPAATPPSSGSGSGNTDTPPPKSAKLTTWQDDPQGAYTVVVYKFPDKSGAKLKAQEVANTKLPAGIFHSDDYESLEPGSWVVFIGEFDTADEASAAEAKYDRAGYPGEVTWVGHQQSPGTDTQATPATTNPQP